MSTAVATHLGDKPVTLGAGADWLRAGAVRAHTGVVHIMCRQLSYECHLFLSCLSICELHQGKVFVMDCHGSPTGTQMGCRSPWLL